MGDQAVATNVISYSISLAAIAQLADQYKEPQVPATPGEYEVLKADIKVIRDYRVAVDKERKVQTATALQHQRDVNAAGHALMDALKAIEEPMKACKLEVDEAEERKVREKEEAEEKRLQAIHGRIERIKNVGLVTMGITLEEIDQRLALCEKLDPADGTFDEYAKHAADAKQFTVQRLNEAREAVVSAAAAAEQLAKDQEKLAAQQREADDREAELKRKEDESAADQRKKDEEEQAAKDAELEKLRQKELEEKRKTDEIEAAEHAKKIAPDKEKLRLFAQVIRELAPMQCADLQAQKWVDDAMTDLEKVALSLEMAADQL